MKESPEFPALRRRSRAIRAGRKTQHAYVLGRSLLHHSKGVWVEHWEKARLVVEQRSTKHSHLVGSSVWPVYSERRHVHVAIDLHNLGWSSNRIMLPLADYVPKRCEWF